MHTNRINFLYCIHAGSCVLRGLSNGCCDSRQLTCTGACGVGTTGPCFCDQMCHSLNDCCFDVLEIGCFPRSELLKN